MVDGFSSYFGDSPSLLLILGFSSIARFFCYNMYDLGHRITGTDFSSDFYFCFMQCSYCIYTFFTSVSSNRLTDLAISALVWDYIFDSLNGVDAIDT